VLPEARVTRAVDADVFTVPRRLKPAALPAAGRPLPVRGVTASAGAEPERIIDGAIGTVWLSPELQVGGEQVIADLGETGQIGGLELDLGRYTFAYPRMVSIEVSDDAAAWREVWRGDAATTALRGALISPATVPLRFTFAAATGRYVRVTQLDEAPQPWAIAELVVLGPPSP
jgi:hypothetical protein